MFKKVTCLTLVFIVASTIYSQQSNSYHSKWQVKPSAGYYFPVSKLLNGEATDYLIGYDDKTIYWQLLSVSYFFNKHWGLEFNFQAGSSRNIPARAGRFIESMEKEFGQTHYVEPSTGASFNSFSFIGGHVERGFLGLLYRVESPRFFLYPKFSIGVTSFYTDWGKAYLKEKNSHRVTEVLYASGRKPNDQFTLAPSVAAGYKISKRIYFSLDLLSTFFRTTLVFNKSIRDMDTGQQSLEVISYSKNIVSVGAGLGLIVVIK